MWNTIEIRNKGHLIIGSGKTKTVDLGFFMSEMPDSFSAVKAQIPPIADEFCDDYQSLFKIQNHR